MEGVQVGTADESWAEVYEACYGRLVALVSAVTGSVGEAEEAVQEAFVRALGLTGRRKVVDDPEAWLYRVAVNYSRSRWRRLMTARRYADRVLAEQSGARVEDDPDERLTLLDALRRLPVGQREALALHYLADLSVDAIATRLSTRPGTVKARLSRGRQALALVLTERKVSNVRG